MHLRNRFPGFRVPSAGEAAQLTQKLRDLKAMFLKDVESRRVENVPAIREEGMFDSALLGKRQNVYGSLTWTRAPENGKEEESRFRW